jgi:hypothetical protein
LIFLEFPMTTKKQNSKSNNSRTIGLKWNYETALVHLFLLRAFQWYKEHTLLNYPKTSNFELENTQKCSNSYIAGLNIMKSLQCNSTHWGLSSSTKNTAGGPNGLGEISTCHNKTNKQTTFLNSRNVYTDLVSIVLQSKNLWYMLVEKERRMEKNWWHTNGNLDFWWNPSGDYTQPEFQQNAITWVGMHQQHSRN